MPSVDVEPVGHVEVIAGIGFREVFVGALQVPLAHCLAAVVAGRGGREHAEHGQQARPDIVIVKVAAETDLLDLEFARAELLGRAVDGVILRMIRVVQVVRIEANLRGEKLRVEDRRSFPAGAVHPADVADVRQWRHLVVGRCRVGCLERIGHNLLYGFLYGGHHPLRRCRRFC